VIDSWEFLILRTLRRLPDEEVSELFFEAMKFFGDSMILELLDFSGLGRKEHTAGLLSYCRENESSARSFFHMKNLGRNPNG
jgi:hypothetical protein